MEGDILLDFIDDKRGLRVDRDPYDLLGSFDDGSDRILNSIFPSEDLLLRRWFSIESIKRDLRIAPSNDEYDEDIFAWRREAVEVIEALRCRYCYPSHVQKQFTRQDLKAGYSGYRYVEHFATPIVRVGIFDGDVDVVNSYIPLIRPVALDGRNAGTQITISSISSEGIVLNGWQSLGDDQVFGLQCFVGSRQEDNINNPGESFPGSLGLRVNAVSQMKLVEEYNLPAAYTNNSTFRVSISPPPNQVYKSAVNMYIVSRYYSRSAETVLAKQYTSSYKNLLRAL